MLLYAHSYNLFLTSSVLRTGHLARFTNWFFSRVEALVFLNVLLNYLQSRQFDLSSFIFCLNIYSKKYLSEVTKYNAHKLRFSNLVFHNFRMIKFHVQKTLSLSFMINSISLCHYFLTKIFIEYLFFGFGNRSSHHRYSFKKMFLKIFTGKSCIGVSF